MTKKYLCENCLEYFSEEYILNKLCIECQDKLQYTEDYKTPEFKDMIMTYSDKTLKEHK
jgi:hypothetical protein